jgi:hypothetical protein
MLRFLFAFLAACALAAEPQSSGSFSSLSASALSSEWSKDDGLKLKDRLRSLQTAKVSTAVEVRLIGWEGGIRIGKLGRRWGGDRLSFA